MKMVVSALGQSLDVEIREQGPDCYEIKIAEKVWTVNCSEPLPNVLSLIVDTESYEINVSEPTKKGLISTHFFDESLDLEVADPMKKMLELSSQFKATGKVELTAEMPGKVVRILAQEGQKVEEGQAVLVLVAMKMENALEAPKAGIIKTIHVQEGQNVETGATLLVIE
ncbi:MAG: biotin/lipoyl-binding protein [Acidobacteria bacterium]|nr:biotin/lipoyl-binding protein [Acidobacteriota bacterium]MCB9397934.1 biotin/lipoyl-binding protein [Acidobacteriota bacterium]